MFSGSGLLLCFCIFVVFSHRIASTVSITFSVVKTAPAGQPVMDHTNSYKEVPAEHNGNWFAGPGTGNIIPAGSTMNTLACFHIAQNTGLSFISLCFILYMTQFSIPVLFCLILYYVLYYLII